MKKIIFLFLLPTMCKFSFAAALKYPTPEERRYLATLEPRPIRMAEWLANQAPSEPHADQHDGFRGLLLDFQEEIKARRFKKLLDDLNQYFEENQLQVIGNGIFTCTVLVGIIASILDSRLPEGWQRDQFM